MPYVGLAWLIALVCVGLAVRRLRQVSAVELPSAEALAERVEAASVATELSPELRGDAERVRQLRRAELDESLLDVDRTTQVGAELARSLSRIALVSGTALALLALLASRSRTTEGWVTGVLCFGAGLGGMLASAYLGRLADARSRLVREHWTRVSRVAWTRLERR